MCAVRELDELPVSMLPTWTLAPQSLQFKHMSLRDNLISRPAQHEDGNFGRNELRFRCGVPFLVAEEGNAGEPGHGRGDESRDGEEGVFEDEGLYLFKKQQRSG